MIEVDRKQERRMPHSRRSQRRLAARMAGTDHDYIVCFIIDGHRRNGFKG
jgi:hypothetical protein